MLDTPKSLDSQPDLSAQDVPLRARDLTWLSFNYRVLQEAKDPTVPLLERLKFLAIYSNNLDEFFRVRVAHHRNLLRAGKKTKRILDFPPKNVLRQIMKEVNSQQDEFSRIFFEEIIPELRQHDIYLTRRQDLNEEQQVFVEHYFTDNMLPYVQPVLLLPGKIQVFLNNGALYLTLELEDKSNGKTLYAIVNIPSEHLPRFVELPSEDQGNYIIMLDDLVRHNVHLLFPGYKIINSYSIKLTRDAELYIDDEYNGDLISKIRKSLTKRNVGPATRFIYDREMPSKLLKFMQGMYGFEEGDVLREGRYHNNSDFFKFPDFGMKHLKNTDLEALKCSALETDESILECIHKRDALLYFPYHSYDYVVRFFEEAAVDPLVTHIKVVQYRVAKKSRIMNALRDAAKNGKQVTVFVEVKARFDEETNLIWAEKLEKAGVTVLYSFPGLKVHAKLAVVTRLEESGLEHYGYFSTGNFHEGTAHVYCDFGLFTKDKRLTNEAARIFLFLETVKIPKTKFEHLLVGQFNLRRTFTKLIDKEIKNAKLGRKARITLKMNSLEDPRMIEKLYKASQAGVKINCIIRGICCMQPGKSNLSENIHAVSIVDRFLEHARVIMYKNGGEEHIYLSSADWMRRNLSFRIETAFPVYDPELRNIVKSILNIQLADNVKARILGGKNENLYFGGSSNMALRSQIEIYYFLKRYEDQSAQALENQDEE